MAASLPRIITKFPLPLFGSVEVLLNFGRSKAAKVPQYALWGAPLAAGGLWFVWPAVGDETKISWGIMKDPEAAKKAAAAKEVIDKPVELPPKVVKSIETAYEAHSEPTVDPKIISQIRSGEYGELEKDWEAFHIESLTYNEDDDDDDEEEEEEEEEEGEAEGAGEGDDDDDDDDDE